VTAWPIRTALSGQNASFAAPFTKSDRPIWRLQIDLSGARGFSEVAGEDRTRK
jgi:hypothetical protein